MPKELMVILSIELISDKIYFSSTSSILILNSGISTI